MFKKTKLAAVGAAILGVAGMQSASAVSLNDGESGQVLIFPYYNTNNGFQTQYAIRNTTDDHKAIRMRFRESNYSLDVFDFNVYLSPYDVFTVTVVEDTIDVGGNLVPTGGAKLLTSDRTCTFPSLNLEEGNAFLARYEVLAKEGLNRAKLKFGDDPTEEQIAESILSTTKEGYLEVIEMGVITNEQVKIGITHNSSGVPVNCGVIASAWTSGAFTQGGAVADQTTLLVTTGKTQTFPEKYPSRVNNGFYSTDEINGRPDGIRPPTGGLSGYEVLIQPGTGAAFVGDPAVIDHYSTVAQHYKPDDVLFYLLPSLASGSDTVASVQASNVVDAEIGFGGGEPGDPGTPGFGENLGNAEIVMTVNNLWNYRGDNGFNSTVVIDGEAIISTAPNFDVPFGVNPYPIANVLNTVSIVNDYLISHEDPDSRKTDWVVTFPMRKHGIYDQNIDVVLSTRLFDREEQEPAGGDFGFSPPVQGKTDTLGTEVNVITFNNPQGVLGTNEPHNIALPVGFDFGWGVLNFDSTSTSVYNLTARYPNALRGTVFGSGHAFGVPAIGFAAIQGTVVGGTAGETVQHTFHRVANADIEVTEFEPGLGDGPDLPGKCCL